MDEQQRQEQEFTRSFDRNTELTNGIFRWLLPLQWIVVVGVALLVTPRTWIGATAQVHVHVISAVVLGGLLTLFPLWLLRAAPRRQLTRATVGVAQLVFSGLIIHVTGGRIESHFHIFASLALLAFYRDWKVLLIATAVTGADHLVRGLLLPQSIYGLTTPQIGRTFEHIGWVVFQDIFLLIGIASQRSRMREAAGESTQLQDATHKTNLLLTQIREQLNIGAELTTSTDQALEMIKRINAATGQLAETEQTIDGAAGDLASSAADTSQRMELLSERAEDQSSHVTESSASIEEMVANISSVNQIVQKQSESITRVSGDVGTAQSAAVSLGASVQRLDEAGSQINEMVGVIANVAAQTQLLAMNAAIEAAHAGDSGRGFAVVAAEIRKLSEQTSSEVSQIRAQVDTIVDAIREAREAVDRTAHSYESAADGFENVRHAFEQIASANQELNQGGTEILQAISALRETTDAVRDLSRETLESQARISDASAMLNTARETLARVAGEIRESTSGVGSSVETAADVAVILEDGLETLAAQQAADQPADRAGDTAD